jgi:hypothetical protein
VKTSPHQDAADVVVRLEEERKLCAIMGDTTAHSFLGEISNLIEQQAKALSEAEAERDRQTGFVQRLQTALAFWMPGVDLRLDEATRELAADDACLLAGGIGARDIPCWGEGMLERALAAEASLAEAMKVIEPFARIPLAFTDDIDDSATVFEFEGGVITLGHLRCVHTARSFLNSASNKEPR